MTDLTEQRSTAKLGLRTLGAVGAWVGLANLLGATVVFIYLGLLFPSALHDSVEQEHFRVALWVFIGYLALAMPLGGWQTHRRFAPIRLWLEEDRPPTDAERVYTLNFPLGLAVHMFVYWFGAAVVFSALNILWFGDAPILHAVGDAVGILLGGLTTCANTYLLIERACRRVFAVALSTATPVHTEAPGIRARILISWALGSGVPLLGIGAALAGRTSDISDVKGAIWFLIFVALIVGGAVLAGAARSVAEPLGALRAALHRVQQGDPDVEVAVDHGGEIGMLQAGFNRMIEGLRERQQLQDLFGRHVGVEVARQAVAQGTALGGEQREVTALFVDVIGSTSLSESVDPRAMVEMLNALFEVVVHDVTEEEGWVDKFEGDATLCVFGAPLQQTDHADRALRAARNIQKQASELRFRYPMLDIGLGVSSGPVVAGNVGTEQRFDYTVIGDPVNEAKRLSELAKERPGRLIASATTIRLAATEAANWGRSETVVARGRSAPTDTYEPNSIAESA